MPLVERCLEAPDLMRLPCSTEGRANLQARGYLLRLERDVVTWIGETDTQRRHRRGKRST